jgi:hypothetical protein
VDLTLTVELSRSLVLRGSCDGSNTKPTLMDYIGVFPNLASVKFDLAYPLDHTLDDRRRPKYSSYRQPKAIPKTTPHSLKVVSLSIEKEYYWYGTRQEGFTSKIISHLKSSIQEAGIDRLDSYELEVATSRSLYDRRSRTFWSDMRKRMMLACTIPARDVHLDVGEIRMDGEASQFVVSSREIGKRYND